MSALDARWSEIMQEVDRLYHLNQTSEGRINCIADYVVRRLNDEQSALRLQLQASESARAKLEEALSPFAGSESGWTVDLPDETRLALLGEGGIKFGLTLGHLRKAAAALTPQEGEG